MKIKKITIENFKSIKEKIELEVKDIANRRNLILLGINESGKSNILDAISLLDPDSDWDYSSFSNSEREGDKVCVSFEFELLDQADLRNYYLTTILDDAISEEIVIERIVKNVEITSGDERNDFYHIWVKNNKKFSQYALLDNNIVPFEGVAIDTSGVVTEPVDKDALEAYLEDNLSEYLDLSLPTVISWKYEPRYLINEAIDLNKFKDDNTVSVPLNNIFSIAGFKDIKAKIESLSGSATKIEALEDQLSQAITTHINKVWKDHKIGIRIRIDGMKLSFLINDSDNRIPKYEVSQRSDGFKHFVSILLNLSVENEMNELDNHLILLDEPEVHLHPSGEKFLRDELLNIAQKNTVIYATHSIFMVDRENLDRHYSVKKEEGITQVSQIDKDNPYQEEVLYEALGTSILEHITSKVLLVEGKSDRDIFNIYAKKFKTDLKPPNLSVISADGCQKIMTYTKFFNKNIIKGFVLFDSDDEGRNEKKKVLELDNYNKANVFEINDVIKNLEGATLEDLFDIKILKESVKEVFDIDIDIDESKPIEKQIKEKLKLNMKPYKDNDKLELKKSFVSKVAKLKKNELKEQKYFKFIKTLMDKLKK